MNDYSPVTRPPEPQWLLAQDAVNAWRGRCLNAFARTEVAVSETLQYLAEYHERGGNIKLPHLVGQRFEALETALAPDGPFASEGKEVLNALQKFRQHDALRTPLCHGSGKITLDQAGRWTLVLRVVSFRSRRMERQVLVWEEDEAQVVARELQADAQRLCSKLERMKIGAAS